jgi:hypothetical protein
MSPEQARGRPVDRRTDVWSFGCVLYEMLAGKQVFGGADVTDSLAAVVRAEPDWSALPADTPPQLRRLLERCLQKDPARRMRDMADVRLDLEEERSLTVAPQNVAARRPVGWMAATALVTLVAGVLGVALWRRPPVAAQPVRFTVAAPEKATLGSFGPPTAPATISPDGRWVAYVSNESGGRSEVYVRPFPPGAGGSGRSRPAGRASHGGGGTARSCSFCQGMEN